MIKKISVVIAVAIALVLLYATTKPDNFMVTRSVTINAPADKIFALISDLHSWDKWSPYEKMDPKMKKTFSGAEKGKGAAVLWEGNMKVGKGSMVATEVVAPFKIVFKVNMEKPMKAHNTGEFTLEEKDGATIVTWSAYGSKPYISKVMSIFINCEKMLGKDFETGLGNLKTVSEAK